MIDETEQDKELIRDIKVKLEEIDKLHIDTINQFKDVVKDAWNQIPETIYFKYNKLKVNFDKKKLWAVYKERGWNEGFYSDLKEILMKDGFPEEAFPMDDAETNFNELVAYEEALKYVKQLILEYLHDNNVLEGIPDFEYGLFSGCKSISNELRDRLHDAWEKFGLNYFWNKSYDFYWELDEFHFSLLREEYKQWLEELKNKVLNILNSQYPLSFRQIRENLGVEANSNEAKGLEEVLSNPPFSYTKRGNCYIYMTMEQKERLEITKSEKDMGAE